MTLLRSSLRALALALVLGLAPSALAAGNHTDLTDLSETRLAAPVTPGPTREAASVALTQWGLDRGALAVSADPQSGATAILLPRGSHFAPPATGLAFRAVVASRPAGAYNAVQAAVERLDWSEDAPKYGYMTRLDAFTDRVVVETNAPPSVTERLEGRFGGILRVERTPIAERTSRDADAAPHRGGARIYSSAVGCTLGPTVAIGGTRYGTTAGHCGPNGTGWSAGGFSFGYTNARPDYPNTDVERITGSTYGPEIYYGSTTTSGVLSVVGAGDPAGAITVTMSGASSGSITGTVTDLNVSFTTSAGTTTGCFSSTAVPVPGDSGSPVHVISGSAAGVRGMMVATTGVRGISQKWSRISSVLGASIVTI